MAASSDGSQPSARAVKFREHLTAIMKRKDLGLTRDQVALIKAVHDAAVPAAFWRYEDAEENSRTPIARCERVPRRSLSKQSASCRNGNGVTGSAKSIGRRDPSDRPSGRRCISRPRHQMQAVAGFRPSLSFTRAMSTSKPRISAIFKRGYPFSESFRQRSFDGRGDPVWVVFAGNVGNDAVLTDDDVDGEGIRAFVVLVSAEYVLVDGSSRPTGYVTCRLDTKRWTPSMASPLALIAITSTLSPYFFTSRLSMSGNSRLQTGQNVAK